MKATLERTPGSRVVLDIEVPPEEMAPEIEQATRRLARQTRIPGFRPGKAPVQLVERVLGRPRILQEALNPVVERAFREALGEQGLQALDQAQIEVKEYEDGQPLHFVATVPVRPDIRLGDYRAIRVSPEPKAVTPADVDAALKQLQESRGTWVPTDEPAADGHLVTLQTVGQVADGPRIDEPRVEGILGAGRLRAEIEAVARGLAPGASAEVDLEFPPTDANAALRGRMAHVRVEVLEVKRQELPPLDDGFAAEVSECQTLEEFRAALGNRLRRTAEAQARQAALDAAVRQLTDAAEVEMPEVLVERRIDTVISNLDGDLGARGVRLSDYLESEGQTLDGLREDFRSAAERDVRLALVLDALARDAGLSPTEGEIDAEIGRRAARSGLDPAHYRRLANRPDHRAGVRAELGRNKAVRLLRDIALPPAAEEGDEAHDGEDGAPGAAPGS